MGEGWVSQSSTHPGILNCEGARRVSGLSMIELDLVAAADRDGLHPGFRLGARLEDHRADLDHRGGGGLLLHDGAFLPSWCPGPRNIPLPVGPKPTLRAPLRARPRSDICRSLWRPPLMTLYNRRSAVLFRRGLAPIQVHECETAWCGQIAQCAVFGEAGVGRYSSPCAPGIALLYVLAPLSFRWHAPSPWPVPNPLGSRKPARFRT